MQLGFGHAMKARTQTPLAIAGSVGIASLLALFVACRTDTAETGKNPSAAMGSMCTNPIQVEGYLARKPFPSNTNLVPVTGSGPVPEGGLAFVREGTSGHALAIVIGGQPQPIPGSSGAITVLGAKMPKNPDDSGPDVRVLVFSRATLTPGPLYAGSQLYKPSNWFLEIRLFAADGSMLGSQSIPYFNEAVKPVDIDTSGFAFTTSVLVQLDKRGVVTRFPGDLAAEPASMQIVEVGFQTGALVVEPGFRESVAESDFQVLSAATVAPVVCPEDACGTLMNPVGDDTNCGACAVDAVCVRNVCQARSTVPGGTCVPATYQQLCVDGACGRKYDGCGGIVTCGGCAPGLACGATEAGKCGSATALRPVDVRGLFGGKVCGCFASGTASTLDVGCDAGESCMGGLCVGGAGGTAGTGGMGGTVGTSGTGGTAGMMGMP
jgi:hypothetical protein